MALMTPATGGRLVAVPVTEGDRMTAAEAIARRAAAIRSLAAGHRRIALLPPATADGVAALLGLLAVPVASVILHPRWSDAELVATAARARATLLLHGMDAPPPALLAIAVDLRGLGGVADPAVPSDASDDLPRHDPAGELVLPTSGTSAAPRLVRLPADRLVASASAWAAHLPPATGWLLSLGLGHVAGIGIVVRAALAGIPVAIPSPGLRLDAAIAEAAALGIAVSHCSLVPTQLARLLDDGIVPPAALRAVLLGGGPIAPALVGRALDAGWPVHPTWGMTEAASAVTAATPAEARRTPSAAGRPLRGISVRVSDPAAPERPLAPGADGELQVRGPVVAAGLLDDADGWRARLTPDGWLRTGDLGHIGADGTVTVIDRIDDLIVRDGENVAPAAVEAALLALPGIRDAAVTGAADPVRGSVPVAFVAATPGNDPADAAHLAALATVLAPFRRPAAIVRVPEVPRIGAGKAQRRLLRPAAVAALARPPADGGESGPEPRHLLARDGGLLLVRAAPRAPGDARPAIVLLHATLSSSRQLLRLAGALADAGRVILVDRRGSGGSVLPDPGPVPIERHVADVVDALDALGEAQAVVVGHSFGGVVALELAARHPDRVGAVLAYEPPYLPLAPEPDRAALIGVAAAVARGWSADGPAGATRAFLAVVAPGTVERLPAERLAPLEAAGSGVLADAAMPGLDPAGLARIAAPVLLVTGDASEPWYAPIADALAAAIPGARRAILPGARHAAPILTPGALAERVLTLPPIAGPPPAASEDRP